jgi:hypothetical protein
VTDVFFGSDQTGKRESCLGSLGKLLCFAGNREPGEAPAMGQGGNEE